MRALGCGGDIQLIAFITDPGPIRKILPHRGSDAYAAHGEPWITPSSSSPCPEIPTSFTTLGRIKAGIQPCCTHASLDGRFGGRGNTADGAGNTLVIFTSDDGPEIMRLNNAESTNVMPVGAYDRVRYYRHSSMGRWRGSKDDAWEGAHHVPFLARWPGHVSAGSTRLCLKTRYLASSGSFALWLRPAPSPYLRIWLLRRPCQRPKQLALGPTVAFSGRA